MQTRKKSFKEAIVNTMVGYVVNVAASPFIYSLFGIEYTIAKINGVVICYTIISIVRGYVIRRWYNRKAITIPQ